MTDAWRQAEDALRCQLPAGQLIFWTRWLIGEDFVRMWCPLGGLEKALALDWKTEGDAACTIVLDDAQRCEGLLNQFFQCDPDVLKKLRTLEQLLGSLCYEAAFERMDFKAASRCASRIGVNNELQIRRALWYESAFTAGDAALILNPPAGSNFRAMVEEEKTMSAELQLDATLWRITAALAAHETHPSTNGCATLHEFIGRDRLDYRIRFFDFAVEAGASGSRLRAFDMWMQIIDARIAALSATDGEPETWSAVYKHIDRARALSAGLPEHRRAIVELFAAVVVRQQIERLILDPEEKDWPSKSKNRQQAVSKVRLLRLILDRARDHLRRGRRNTRWWRLYFRLEIRWTLCALLSMLWYDFPQSIVRSKKSANQSRLLDTLRIGLRAIRSRLDLDFKHANSYQTFCTNHPELHKWWIAIGKVSCQIALRFTKEVTVAGEKSKARDEMRMWCPQYYIWLSEVAGLPMPEAANVVKKELAIGVKSKPDRWAIKPLIEQSLDGLRSLLDPS